MKIRRCHKLESGYLEYEFNTTDRYLKILNDFPETGEKGGTFSKDNFSFDEINKCLDSFNGLSFIPVKITAFFNKSCSNTGSMLTAIFIDCGIVEKINHGEYKATSKRL